MSNLYELTGDLLQLQEMLENEDIDPEALADTMEAVNGEYDIKMESYAKCIKNLESNIVAIKSEVDRLNGKRKNLENNIDKLKAAMFDSMKATGKTKAGGKLFTVAIQKNGGKAPVILKEGVTVSDLPDELVRITEAPNMDAIRQYLDNGGTDYAYYGERGESLRIK